ncbi:response regulator [Burkholderia glumae]|uniref:response regulator n=1 Tax=Burkholderia glumae TaxID=337 RepID=UPI002037280F|nr:response regulator [Burkholderia glumae]MCM2551810.1 response regulator [Burkholderia glumae]
MDATLLRVYVVEPAAAIRRRVAALLEPLVGVSVVGESEDHAMAFAGIVSSGADVAVIELRLPSGSGFELLGELARFAPHVTTVILTNLSGPAFRAASRDAGAHYFFDKTTEFELACHTIDALAHARRPQPASERVPSC